MWLWIVSASLGILSLFFLFFASTPSHTNRPPYNRRHRGHGPGTGTGHHSSSNSSNTNDHSHRSSSLNGRIALISTNTFRPDNHHPDHPQRNEATLCIRRMLDAGCVLHTMTVVDTDAAEEDTRRWLEEMGLFEHGLHPERVLFCETEKGKEAFARQLEPDIFIDDRWDTPLAVAPHIPLVLCTASSSPAATGPSASHTSSRHRQHRRIHHIESLASSKATDLLRIPTS